MSIITRFLTLACICCITLSIGTAIVVKISGVKMAKCIANQEEDDSEDSDTDTEEKTKEVDKPLYFVSIERSNYEEIVTPTSNLTFFFIQDQQRENISLEPLFSPPEQLNQL